jgi:putative phosphoribosyl transferase
MNHSSQTATARARDVQIRSGKVILQGDLSIPTGAQGVVLFAHGSGSSRHSPRNQFVARTIREAGVGTLLFSCSSLVDSTIP